MSGTLPDLLFDLARRFGGRPALAIRRGLRTQVWSYGDLAGAARVAAARLEAAGLQPGDRVLTLAPNSPELVVSMFGVWLAGGVLVPIDLRTTPDVMARMADLTEPRLLIASAPAEGLEGLRILSPLELATPAGAGARGSGAEGEPAPGPGPHSPTPGLAEIVFTSGTTAAPKGVMLTHRNILSNVVAAREAMPIRRGERLLSLLPLSHMMEQTAGLLAPLAAGATIFYAISRRSTALMAALQRHRVGLLVCVPEILKLLLAGIEREVERSGQRRRWELLLVLAGRLPMAARPALFRPLHRRLGGHLRLVLCGGAALEPELWRTWERLGVRVVQGFGATECAPIISSNRLNRRLPGAVGWPLRDVELRLAADGEILVRGPSVTPGYWCDRAATAAAFEDGWYRTGDVGAFGPRGELRLLGRKKEMIVLPDGRNVFPQDIEAELRREPGIEDCVVVGKAKPGGGEEVHVVIVPVEGDEDVEGVEDVRIAVRRANSRLGPHQQIGGLTIWPEADFPRTPAMKVKRAEVLAVVGRADPVTPGRAAATIEGGGGRGGEAPLYRLLARASGRPPAEIRPEADLALDLGLDSLARVELAVLLEEELGRSLPDEEMAVLRTVADLQAALELGGSADAVEPLPAWPRRAPARPVRSMLQDVVLFPLLRLLYRPWRVEGAERLRGPAGPALLIANHTSHLDSLTILALLPPTRRRRTAVAAAADYFFETQPLATSAALGLGAFPFHRRGAVSTSLAYCGDLADDGYSILIFPEGTRSQDGRLQPFKSGIGLLARELGLPVIPIHLAGLHAILPKGRRWPRPGPVVVRVGEPIRPEPGLSNAEAARALEAAMRRLAAERPDRVLKMGPDSCRVL
jgi:long-chain acyl-CoA synthetase